MPWAAAAGDTLAATSCPAIMEPAGRSCPAAAGGGCQPVEQAGESLIAGDVHAGEGHLIMQQDGGAVSAGDQAPPATAAGDQPGGVIDAAGGHGPWRRCRRGCPRPGFIQAAGDQRLQVVAIGTKIDVEVLVAEGGDRRGGTPVVRELAGQAPPVARAPAVTADVDPSGRRWGLWLGMRAGRPVTDPELAPGRLDRHRLAERNTAMPQRVVVARVDQVAAVLARIPVRPPADLGARGLGTGFRPERRGFQEHLDEGSIVDPGRTRAAAETAPGRAAELVGPALLLGDLALVQWHQQLAAAGAGGFQRGPQPREVTADQRAPPG